MSLIKSHQPILCQGPRRARAIKLLLKGHAVILRPKTFRALSIEVNEAEVKRYAYTPKEKYEKLIEKNPLLDKLRKEFDLEI